MYSLMPTCSAVAAVVMPVVPLRNVCRGGQCTLVSRVAGGQRHLDRQGLMPLLANLICGSPARNHDFDFARRHLLDALYAAGGIRTDVAQNYPDPGAIEAGDLLVSYTSQVPATDEQCFALRRYLEQGGRWFALHASNSVRDNPYLPGILGSRLITHPPYLHYAVSITRTDEPLLGGIAPFEVDDELYVIEHA